MARSQTCTFCRILAGELPATVVLDDDELIAFLDTKPVFRGHVLLVPKLHVRTLADLPAERVGHFVRTAQRLERAVERGLDVPGSMVLVTTW